jgi:hypothetical protein
MALQIHPALVDSSLAREAQTRGRPSVGQVFKPTIVPGHDDQAHDGDGQDQDRHRPIEGVEPIPVLEKSLRDARITVPQLQ